MHGCPVHAASFRSWTAAAHSKRGAGEGGCSRIQYIPYEGKKTTSWELKGYTTQSEKTLLGTFKVFYRIHLS